MPRKMKYCLPRRTNPAPVTRAGKIDMLASHHGRRPARNNRRYVKLRNLCPRRQPQYGSKEGGGCRQANRRRSIIASNMRSWARQGVQTPLNPGGPSYGCSVCKPISVPAPEAGGMSRRRGQARGKNAIVPGSSLRSHGSWLPGPCL